MSEEWRTYKYYDSDYSVSNTGRVIRVNYNEELNVPSGGQVYLHSKEHPNKYVSIGRLMAVCFLDMPDDDQHVAYRINPAAGFTIDNMTWDTLHNACVCVMVSEQRGSDGPKHMNHNAYESRLLNQSIHWFIVFVIQ